MKVRVSDLIRRYDDHGIVHITPARAVWNADNYARKTGWHRTSESSIAICSQLRSRAQLFHLYGDEVPHSVTKGTAPNVATTCLWCVALTYSLTEWETDG